MFKIAIVSIVGVFSVMSASLTLAAAVDRGRERQVAAAADAKHLDGWRMAGADPQRAAAAVPPHAARTPGPLLARFLAGPAEDVEEIIFAVRTSAGPHWYENFGYYADAPERTAYPTNGGRLCRLKLRTGELKVIFEDPKGAIRDPQVHYQGKKVLFACRKGGTPTYHLYEIDVDGKNLVQLTEGPDDDIEPAYLPDGGIVFVSSRCHRFVNCWNSRVATLYRCNADGKNVRMLSANIEHDNTPWVLPDGRVLYMRWEYVDRSQMDFHHLWTMNPDGTGQMVFFGNMHPGTVMLDAKPIPGTRKVVASFSPGHGKAEHAGAVVVVDPRRGPDVQAAARQISKGDDFRDPYALSEDCFLVAAGRQVLVMDGQGATETIYSLAASDGILECHEPRPLGPRAREPIVPSRVDLSQATGRLFLEDIYQGRNMAGVTRGEIKKLLVLQQAPKPVNFSAWTEPVTMGGTFTLAQVLGTVPVEPDGSAHFEVPALRPLFLVALDENDLSVKRMQSFLTVQPGETMGCVGCHEQRTLAPHVRPDAAALRGPARPIQPVPGVSEVLDFPRDIQPVLDRHCAKCHNPDQFAGRVDLTGDRTPSYSMAFETIARRKLVSDGQNATTSNRAPRTIGSSSSRLMKLIDGGHYDARLSPQETAVVRLWIETGAAYPGTYAALGCGMYPVALPWEPMVGRCVECHFNKWAKDPKTAVEKLLFNEPNCNLSRPEKSPILRFPLAKEAGGLGLCKRAVFATAQDPLYQEMLASVRKAASALQQGKRFDMPGFRPSPHYVREMQRFGVLPGDLRPNGPLDIYRLDRAYWESFYHHP
jgi:hypothetical protein